MTILKRAAHPRDLLRLIPPLIGYHPRRSVVLLPLAEGRSLGVLRLDLPPEGTEVAFASTALGIACRVDTTDAVLAIVYTDRDAGPEPADRVLEALREHADRCGVHFADGLVVSPTGWRRFGDDATEPPHPLSEITLEDDAELPRDQYVGARVPRIGTAARERVRAAYGEHERRNAFPGVHDDLPSLFESALTDDSDDVSARLIWCLARPALRDIGLLQWVGGHALGEAAQEGQRAWQGGAEYAPDLARVLWGEGPRPRRSRLERALERSRVIAAHTPRHERAGALSVCAWLSWALGRSTHAERYAALAREVDPAHGFADIVARFVAAGHLPAWAFEPA